MWGLSPSPWKSALLMHVLLREPAWMVKIYSLVCLIWRGQGPVMNTDSWSQSFETEAKKKKFGSIYFFRSLGKKKRNEYVSLAAATEVIVLAVMTTDAHHPHLASLIACPLWPLTLSERRGNPTEWPSAGLLVMRRYWLRIYKYLMLTLKNIVRGSH